MGGAAPAPWQTHIGGVYSFIFGMVYLLTFLVFVCPSSWRTGYVLVDESVRNTPRLHMHADCDLDGGLPGYCFTISTPKTNQMIIHHRVRRVPVPEWTSRSKDRCIIAY